MADENTPSTPSDQSALATAVASSIPEPAKVFGYGDTHTAENTPLKAKVDSLPESVGKLEDTEEVRGGGFTTVYIGNSKEDFESVQELVSIWFSVSSIRNASRSNRINKSMLNAATAEWHQFCDEKYPDVTYDEMELRAADMYRYLQNTSDPIMVKTRMMLEDGPNVYRASDQIIMRDITGMVPSATIKPNSLSEEMERGASRGNASPYLYAVNLRNSFCKFQFSRGHKTDSAIMINEINATIRGYVRTVGGNSLILSTIAGYRAVWNWLVPYITSCSVEGIADFNDLARVIRFRDMEVILAALLSSFEDDEANMDLRCFNLACDWSSFEKINPALLVRNRPSAHTDEELAILGNIFNGTARYNAKQVLDLIDNSKYGIEDTYLYNERQTIRLTMGSTSLAEAFAALDYMVTQVDPQIASARNNITDQEALEAQIGVILSSVGGCEFLHWVKEFALLPEPGAEGEPKVFKRRDSDQYEFNKGLRGVLKVDSYLDKQVTRFVYTVGPYMSKTFIGLRNCKCPKCGKGAEETNGQARNLGYTPIDIFMTFFTHTQFMLVRSAEAKQRAEREVRS